MIQYIFPLLLGVCSIVSTIPFEHESESSAVDRGIGVGVSSLDIVSVARFSTNNDGTMEIAVPFAARSECSSSCECDGSTTCVCGDLNVGGGKGSKGGYYGSKGGSKGGNKGVYYGSKGGKDSYYGNKGSKGSKGQKQDSSPSEEQVCDVFGVFIPDEVCTSESINEISDTSSYYGGNKGGKKGNKGGSKGGEGGEGSKGGKGGKGGEGGKGGKGGKGEKGNNLEVSIYALAKAGSETCRCVNTVQLKVVSEPPTCSPSPAGSPTGSQTDSPTGSPRGSPTDSPIDSPTGSPTVSIQDPTPLCLSTTCEKNLGKRLSDAFVRPGFNVSTVPPGSPQCFPSVGECQPGLDNDNPKGRDDALAFLVGGNFTSIKGAEVEGNMVVLGNIVVESSGVNSLVSKIIMSHEIFTNLITHASDILLACIPFFV